MTADCDYCEEGNRAVCGTCGRDLPMSIMDGITDHPFEPVHRYSDPNYPGLDEPVVIVPCTRE